MTPLRWLRGFVVAVLFAACPLAACGQDAPASDAPAPANVEAAAPAAVPPARRAASGPLANVPAGQLVVIHVPDAARVVAGVDRLLATLRRDPATSPLRRVLEVAKIPLPPPPGRGLPDPREWTIASVTGSVTLTVPPSGVRTGGVTLSGRIGDDAEPPNAVRGVELTDAEREALVDADILARLDVHLLLSSLEADYRAYHKGLSDRLAEARQGGQVAKSVALLEQRLRATEALWARAHEISAVSAGLILGDEALDVRLCLTVTPESRLARALAGHAPLAGELNPPLPTQEFAALSYASFDAEGLAGLLQWLTDAAVEAAVARGAGEQGLGPAEVEALGGLFKDFGALLGRRAALVVPIRDAAEPVFQVDGVVQLKDADSGAAWHGRVPATLDALAYLAEVLIRSRAGEASGLKVETSLVPALPEDTLPIDRWRMSIARASEPGRPPGPMMRLVESLLGPEGLTLWNTADGRFAYFSVASSPERIGPMIARNTAARLGRAGDDELTAEALRHVLRRANVVVVLSPSLLVQLASRVVLRSIDGPYRQPLDVPLVAPKSLAAASLRFDGDSLSARLYIPLQELEALLSTWRTLRLLDGARPPPTLAPAE